MNSPQNTKKMNSIVKVLLIIIVCFFLFLIPLSILTKTEKVYEEISCLELRECIDLGNYCHHVTHKHNLFGYKWEVTNRASTEQQKDNYIENCMGDNK